MREVKYQAYVPELNKIVDVFGLNPMNQTVYLSHQQLFGTPGDDVLMSYGEPLDESDQRVKLREYTGLKDKNDTDIYEGDYYIMPPFDDKSERYLVEWKHSGFHLPNSDAMLVVGNENPELLTKEKS